MIDLSLIVISLPSLLKGALVTLQIASLAAILGLVVGTALSFAEQSKITALRFFAVGYITVFRGTPMLVQILFVYYVLPEFHINLPPFLAASVAMGLNSGAYISQAIRSGINAVCKGQIDAAQTLGLSPLKTLRFIVLPQAFQVTLPSLCNELVTLIKDSSLASIIGVLELSKEASIIRSRTYDAFSILLASALIYLILTTFVSYFVKKLEKKEEAYV